MMLNLSNNIAFLGAMSFNYEATAKSVAEFGDSNCLQKGARCHAYNDSPVLDYRSIVVFYCVESTHIQIMVAWIGISNDMPASFLSGSPTRFMSPPLFGDLGGDLKDHYKKVAIMPNQISLTQVAPVIHVENGHTFITSNELAQVFNKSHKNVIRDIEALECSDIFRGLNFELSFYDAITGNNAKRSYKCYHITKDGFSFLAMGFTGKKAAQFKEAYINAFNQMEAKLNNSHTELSTEPQDDDLLMTYLNSVRGMTRAITKLIALQSDVLPLLRPDIEFQTTHNLALAEVALALEEIHSVSSLITFNLIKQEVKAMEALCQ